MIIGITDEEREAFMNNGMLLTSNEEVGSKGLTHRKRNDLVSDRTDDCEEDEEKSFVEKVLKMPLNKEGEEEFLVKWLGYPLSEATWELFDHLSGVEACKYLFVLIHTIV